MSVSSVSLEDARKISAGIQGLRLTGYCVRGAFGAVYLCRDAVDRPVALKIIDKQRLGVNWQREFNGIRAYCRMIRTDQNLITVYHAGDNSEFFYCLMEAADNILPGDSADGYRADTLQQRIDSGVIFSPETIREMMANLMSGVAALHEKRLIHRDIKPDNILFIGGKAKLGDIGLVASEENPVSFAGTPDFLPPEIFNGSGSSAAQDVYALGKVLYCMISGYPAGHFPEFPPRVFHDKKYRPLCRFCLQACSPTLKEQFSDIASFRRHFEALHSGKWKKLLFLAGILLAASAFAVAGIGFHVRLMQKNIPEELPESSPRPRVSPRSTIPGAALLFDSDFQNPSPEIRAAGTPGTPVFGADGLSLALPVRWNADQFAMLEMNPKQIFLKGNFEVVLQLTGNLSGTVELTFFDADSMAESTESEKIQLNLFMKQDVYSGGLFQTPRISSNLSGWNTGEPLREIRLVVQNYELLFFLNGQLLLRQECGAELKKTPVFQFNMVVYPENSSPFFITGLSIFAD